MTTRTLPQIQVNIRTITPALTQLLRIRVEKPTHVQLLWQPDTTTNPGHGFVALFADAELSDHNAAQLHLGTVDLRIRPEAVKDVCLMMLNRLLQPFQCEFEMVVNGTYQINPATGVGTVIAESIAACSVAATIQ